jgi:hypothetical protein
MCTLADLTRISGLKRRTAQVWAEGGALIADEATDRMGSGVHRVFSRDEAIICVMLAQFELVSPPIGRLKFLAGLIRKELKRAHSIFKDDIEAVIAGKKSGAALGIHSDGQVWFWLDDGDHQLKMKIPTKRKEMVIVVGLDEALSALRFV